MSLVTTRKMDSLSPLGGRDFSVDLADWSSDTSQSFWTTLATITTTTLSRMSPSTSAIFVARTLDL